MVIYRLGEKWHRSLECWHLAQAVRQHGTERLERCEISQPPPASQRCRACWSDRGVVVGKQPSKPRQASARRLTRQERAALRFLQTLEKQAQEAPCPAPPPDSPEPREDTALQPDAAAANADVPASYLVWASPEIVHA